MDLSSGEMFQFVEGTHLQNIVVFAGKGVGKDYRNAYMFSEKYGGKTEDWQHCKALGWIETPEGDMRAEVRWSQCEGIGKFEFFIKRWLE